MAQVAHTVAQMFISLADFSEDSLTIKNIDPEFMYWLKESFTKIVYKARTEEQLHLIQSKAKQLDIPTFPMVEDDGVFTALAFKPQDIEKIKPFLNEFDLRLA